MKILGKKVETVDDILVYSSLASYILCCFLCHACIVKAISGG